MDKQQGQVATRTLYNLSLKLRDLGKQYETKDEFKNLKNVPKSFFGQDCEVVGNRLAAASTAPERISSFSTEDEQPCVICMDSVSDGIKCNGTPNHFTCLNCFPDYVISSIENALLFKKNNLLIKCPYHTSSLGCISEDWDMSTVASALLESEDKKKGKNALERYMRTLKEWALRTDNTKSVGVMEDKVLTKESVVNVIIEALNLKCPSRNCNTLLDPNPDGCKYDQFTYIILVDHFKYLYLPPYPLFLIYFDRYGHIVHCMRHTLLLPLPRN